MCVIRVNDLSIKFNVRFLNERMTVRRTLMQLYHGLSRWESPLAIGPKMMGTSFLALKDVSFTIAQGETVGVIGHNGAGKSTLLKALAGIYRPDQGTVETRGSIGTLLSLGGGFNYDMTGRENIELNGLFMGLTLKKIKEREERIVEFSELGKFIDAPLKTYSSGMRARLGFSIAISLDPDIVLLDEVLAAGDEAFRRKAGNLLEHFKAAGKTIVIASHQMSVITNMCSRALLLDHGRLVGDGDAKEIVTRYNIQVASQKQQEASP